jgi:chorismate dehydratase
MAGKVRIGAVAYLNTRPLVFGLEHGLGGERIELSYDVPAALADRLARGEIDVGLIPTIELARIPDLEIVPGLGIVSRGPARSVLLAARGAPEHARRVALDPESRTTNALTRILFAELWGTRPEFEIVADDLEAALREHDAVVRIGDKALFERLPAGVGALDLGQQWDRAMGLPFVYAVWACRAGVLDDELCDALHESLRRGASAIDSIAADYAWKGRTDPDLARDYLTRNLRFHVGPAEMDGLTRFLRSAARLGIVPAAARPRLVATRRPRFETRAEVESGA